MLKKWIGSILIVSLLFTGSVGPFSAPLGRMKAAWNRAVQVLPVQEEGKARIWEGDFELPLCGAAGYASITISVRQDSGSSFTLAPGDPFTILAEDGRNLRIRDKDGREGLTDRTYCMINVPDVIPSAVYKDTNSEGAVYRSLGKWIIGVTSVKLYDVWYDNERLGRKEYAMPILYDAAKKLAVVQRKALENGETLVIYETFRPYETQRQVAEGLDQLRHADPEVNHAVTDAPWSAGWFIAQNVSLHQRGCALDVSLGKVTETTLTQAGDYLYYRVTGYTEYTMQTPMHELSRLSAAHAYPVTTRDKEAWKTAELAPTMTADAIRLRKYFTENGFCPLSSEWWHFNDLDCVEATESRPSDGNYYICAPLSRTP